MINALTGIMESAGSLAILPGALHRWRSQNVVLDGSSNVQQITDLIGTNHFTQATSGLRPALVTNVQNGKPAIRFTGGSQKHLDGSAIAISSAYTVYMVRNRVPAAGNAEYILGGNLRGIFAAQPASNRSFGQFNTNTLASTMASNNNGMAIYTHQVNELFRNNVSMPRAISMTVDLTGLSRIGGRTDVTTTYYQGDLLDIIIYPIVHDAAQLAYNWAVLNAEYALY